MPQTIGDYSYTVVDGDMTVPNLVSKPRKIFPVESDSSIYILEEDYMQFIDYYEPLVPSTRHETKANLYFVKDTPIRDAGNGVGAWTRTWTVLPGYDETGKKLSYVNSDFESYVFSVPGITTTQGLFLLNWIINTSYSGDNMIFTTGDPGSGNPVNHDIVAGKGAGVGYWVSDPINNFRYWRWATKMALDGTAGSTLVIKKIKDIGTIQPVYCQRAFSNSEPYQKTVASRVDRDYWLPGVNIDSAEEIPIVQEFQILDLATGNRTEYLSETTSPTIDEYRQLIEDDAWLVAEPSVLRRWNGSEIIERTTRYVKYTL